MIVDSAWNLKKKCVNLLKDFQILFDDTISMWTSRKKTLHDLK